MKKFTQLDDVERVLNKMREILFRGKVEDWDNWVEGYYVHIPIGIKGEEKHLIQAMQDGRMGILYDVIPETVGQYTGLKDKNGRRIFEGDIIKYADAYDYNCYLESLERPEDYEGCNYSDIFTTDEVVYGIAIGYPAFDLNKHDFDCNGLSELIESMQYHYEVIGNIHDNPELLEVEHDQ